MRDVNALTEISNVTTVMLHKSRVLTSGRLRLRGVSDRWSGAEPIWTMGMCL